MNIDLKKKEIVQIFLAQIIASIFTGSLAIGAYHWRLNQRLDKIEHDYSEFEKTQVEYKRRLENAEMEARTATTNIAVAANEIKNLNATSSRILDTVQDLQRDLTGRVTK